MNGYTVGSMIGGMVIPGMLVVLVALAIMVAIIYFMSYVVARMGVRKNDAGKPAPSKSQASAPAAVTPAPASPVPAGASASIAGETVAAICAAVACMIDTPHTVTSILPAAQPAVGAAPVQPARQRPVWGFAGMQQNTRPF